MARFTSMVSGSELTDPSADFKSAKRVEQYRISDSALYIPCGLSWKYIPLSEILSAEESHRTVSAGHCVTVELRRPALEITWKDGAASLNLEKDDSLAAIIEIIDHQTEQKDV